MSTKTIRVPVLFPVFDEETEDINFRKHAIGLATVMCSAVSKYMDDVSKEHTVSASSIGAACFVVSHLIALGFEDERKDQVRRGLVATLALNDPGSASDLAQLPPTDKKLN